MFESINLELEKELDKFDIKEYTINEDGSIDCNEVVISFSEHKLNEIPFKFNRINVGGFSVRNNLLTSLKNCPKYIDSYFNCSVNRLASLEYGPEYVGGDYYCHQNKLETLKGCVEEVYGNFYCFDNQLTSLEFCPMEVEKDFDCSDNKLEYLDRSPMIKGNLTCLDMFETEPEFNGHCEKLIWNL